MLALGMLPVLAFGASPVTVELRGWLFQDFAPSAFPLQHVVCPVLRRMGLHAVFDVVRPGYVPRGEGVLWLRGQPMSEPWRAIVQDEAGPVTLVWGIALSSHLEERQVSRRMAGAAREVLAQAGYLADIESRHDSQRGAALMRFADRGPTDQETADHGTTVRLGTDQAGALPERSRSARTWPRSCSKRSAQGATVDRFVADQVMPFAALAEGESRFGLFALQKFRIADLSSLQYSESERLATLVDETTDFLGSTLQTSRRGPVSGRRYCLENESREEISGENVFVGVRGVGSGRSGGRLRCDRRR